MSSFICTIATLKASNNNISNPSLSETVQNLARSFENHFLAHSVIALPGYMLKNTKLESVFDLSIFNIERIQNFRMKKLCDEPSVYIDTFQIAFCQQSVLEWILSVTL